MFVNNERGNKAAAEYRDKASNILGVVSITLTKEELDELFGSFSPSTK